MRTAAPASAGATSKMYVVGHQHTGMHRDPKPTRRRRQIRQVATMVLRGEEAGLSVVAALSDVLADTSQIRARLT